ncbi:MAG: RNA polymerase sigma factor [Myxococcales bacterium FL481]|nr:MAG: RNA polymerase sigma factor [Myxococcales bacterium FL481]
MSRTTIRGLYDRMEQYVEGDRRAFEELHDLLSSPLRGFLVKLVRSEAAADDLLQVTLLKAHLARERFEVRTGDPDAAVEAWYFTIARNVAMDHLRKQGRELRRQIMGAPDQTDVTDRLVDGDPIVEDRAVEREVRDEIIASVRAAIDKLPPSQREIVELHKLRGMSMAEVAERLQVREGTLRVRAHRSYKALARLLGSSKASQVVIYLVTAVALR